MGDMLLAKSVFGLNNNDHKMFDIVLKQSDKSPVRDKVFSEFKKKHKVHLFGNALDDIVRSINDYYIIDYNGDTYLSVPVKKNFLVDNMDFEINIRKNDLSIDIYQKFGSEKILLVDDRVALGGDCMDHEIKEIRSFRTPSGNFYIKRVVSNPYWYPTKWSAHKELVKPGPQNPFGIWMAELYTTPLRGNYKFNNPDDSGIKIHSTNKPDSIGHYVTHGCIRLNPSITEELFPAILAYSNHSHPVKTFRGKGIYLLEKPFPVTITNS